MNTNTDGQALDNGETHDTTIELELAEAHKQLAEQEKLTGPGSLASHYWRMEIATLEETLVAKLNRGLTTEFKHEHETGNSDQQL